MIYYSQEAFLSGLILIIIAERCIKMANYIDIESVTEGLEKRVAQDLKFRTGKFVWKVKFNIPLDPRTVNNVNLFVTTLGQSPLRTDIRYDSLNNTIEIEPLEAYAQQESYILNITTAVKSKGGQKLKAPIRLQFKIE